MKPLIIAATATMIVSPAAVRANGIFASCNVGYSCLASKDRQCRSHLYRRGGAICDDDYLASPSAAALVDAAYHAVTSQQQNDSDADGWNAIRLATSFLESACPAFLSSDVSDDQDRLVKIGRSLKDLVERHARTPAVDLGASLRLLVEECTILASGQVQVPRVRFGKTELRMPILSLGCMRLQQAWGTAIKTMDDVTPECQENLLNILRYAADLGVNHIETARGYGSSELQLGEAFRTLFESGELKRDDLIIQTKVPLRPTAAEFRAVLERSFEELQLDYVDLLGLHGMNMESQYDLLYSNGENGNLIDVLKEYIAKGKIRHLGFSTHGAPALIRKFIETNDFSYANIHYHFCGSYTASGDGMGNLEIVRLLKEKDMGCFIISAFDKGGMLYAPSKKLRSLTMPEFEPVSFGCHFLWEHERLDGSAPVHTISCGAARPSDLDQPAIAAYLHTRMPREISDRLDAVLEKLRYAEIQALGEDWVNSWTDGLPNYRSSTECIQICNIVWMYNLIQAFGMLEFCKARYASMENNSKRWDTSLSNEENIQNISPGWGWSPGRAIVPGTDYSCDFPCVPEENRVRIGEALEFVHRWCSKEGIEESKDDVPLDWETAYDMRPWTAFPER